MVNKLGDKYGMPFVGTHRTIVKSILDVAHNKEFRVFLITGRRGVGKTRIVHEAFEETHKDQFEVLIGEATVKDDDEGKDMDILEAGND